MSESAPAAVADHRRGARPLAPPAPKGEPLVRHPADVARLVLSLLVLFGLFALAELAPLGVRTFTVELLAIVDGLPTALVNGLVGTVQLTATVVPVVIAALLLYSRRFVLFSLCVLAAVIAAVLMALLAGAFAETIPFEQLGLDRADSWFIGSQYPSATFLAGLTAALVVASPWLARAWRRAGWFLIIAAVVARALTATEVPLRNALLLAIGAAAGSASLLIVGPARPAGRRCLRSHQPDLYRRRYPQSPAHAYRSAHGQCHRDHPVLATARSQRLYRYPPIAQLRTGRSVFVRSSTNAEDLEHRPVGLGREIT